jgi:stage V sporulation protein SpoVS
VGTIATGASAVNQTVKVLAMLSAPLRRRYVARIAGKRERDEAHAT